MLKDSVIGRTDESGVTLPPLHPRCRCVIVYREAAKSVAPPKKSYRRFTNADEADACFKSKSAAWFKTLTPQETTAIARYTGKGHSEINGLLREKFKASWFDEDDLLRLQKIVALIESALSKFEFPDNIIVCRRVGLMILPKFKEAPNGIFLEQGFTTTTLIQGSFVGDLELEISLCGGKGLDAWIEPLSVNPGENEFLINSSMEFKIVEINTDGERPLVKIETLGCTLKGAKNMDKNSSAKKPTAEDKEKLRLYLESHSDKFFWQPDDLLFLDENGNRVSCKELPDKPSLPE